ncbi:XdhC family protein [Haladaptatus sp. ZSTT2]|uniref:XdhC family protein n=1 Tax=Haladaptatus sp. ZSTT2 TaxID=3120515 RepID=UPI00300F7374
MDGRDATHPWSVTTIDIFDQLRDRAAAGKQSVLVTVVNVDGSAYRRPGAKMAVTPTGEPLGAVTPGCLEDPVIDLAQDVAREGTPTIEVFDLTGDDDTWGFGLGCNGIITVLIEPLAASFEAVLDRLAAGESAISATVIASETSTLSVGDRSVFDGEGTPVSVDDHDVADQFGEALRNRVTALSPNGTERVTLDTDDGEVTLFLDGMTPPPELLIFGHHGDVVPVTEVARNVGFRVTVASARGGQAKAENFPAAETVVKTRPPELGGLVDDPTRTYAVIMSHNFIDDRLAFESLLDTEIPYIGLMGPRKRFEQMRDEFREEGRTFTEAELARVATPVGLDLAGSEPTQIALSIVAEALAVANDRDGGRLTTSKGPIHPR